MDTTKLEEFLKNKQWREADEQTCQLMLEVSGREEEGWIDLDSVKKFPCEDLQTIDQLWVHHSDGLYGFSVQKQIYVECGGALDIDGLYGLSFQKQIYAECGGALGVDLDHVTWTSEESKEEYIAWEKECSAWENFCTLIGWSANSSDVEVLNGRDEKWQEDVKVKGHFPVRVLLWRYLCVAGYASHKGQNDLKYFASRAARSRYVPADWQERQIQSSIETDEQVAGLQAFSLSSAVFSRIATCEV
ncbi:MAG: GUN4 domain-containing protein [Pseudanabaena sp. ELA607]